MREAEHCDDATARRSRYPLVWTFERSHWMRQDFCARARVCGLRACVNRRSPVDCPYINCLEAFSIHGSREGSPLASSETRGRRPAAWYGMSTGPSPAAPPASPPAATASTRPPGALLGRRPATSAVDDGVRDAGQPLARPDEVAVVQLPRPVTGPSPPADASARSSTTSTAALNASPVQDAPKSVVPPRLETASPTDSTARGPRRPGGRRARARRIGVGHDVLGLGPRARAERRACRTGRRRAAPPARLVDRLVGPRARPLSGLPELWRRGSDSTTTWTNPSPELAPNRADARGPADASETRSPALRRVRTRRGRLPRGAPPPKERIVPRLESSCARGRTWTSPHSGPGSSTW